PRARSAARPRSSFPNSGATAPISRDSAGPCVTRRASARTDPHAPLPLRGLELLRPRWRSPANDLRGREAPAHADTEPMVDLVSSSTIQAAQIRDRDLRGPVQHVGHASAQVDRGRLTDLIVIGKELGWEIP